MSAEWLAIVLPGEATPDEKGLSPNGRGQAERLVRALREYIVAGPVAVLTSPNPDAVESAALISGAFKAAVEHDRVFYRVHPVSSMELRLAMVPIESRIERYAAVIVITHEPYVAALPGHFTRTKWGTAPIELRVSHAKGTGVLMRLPEKNGIWIPR